MSVIATTKCEITASELNADGSIRSHVRFRDSVATPLKSVGEFYSAGAGGASVFAAGQIVYITVAIGPPPPPPPPPAVTVTITMKCDTSSAELVLDGTVRSHIRVVDLVPVPLRSVGDIYSVGAGGASQFTAGQTVYVTFSTVP